MISKNTRKAYSEVDEFLGLLSEEQRNKIPENIRGIFRQEKDNDYVKNITPNVEIKYQNLMEETLAIIAMLNLNYICESEEEKERLKEVYAINEKKYQDVFQIGFDEENIFETSEKSSNINQEEKQIVNFKKESLLKRIFNKIFKSGGRI